MMRFRLWLEAFERTDRDQIQSAIIKAVRLYMHIDEEQQDDEEVFNNANLASLKDTVLSDILTNSNDRNIVEPGDLEKIKKKISGSESRFTPKQLLDSILELAGEGEQFNTEKGKLFPPKTPAPAQNNGSPPVPQAAMTPSPSPMPAPGATGPVPPQALA